MSDSVTRVIAFDVNETLLDLSSLDRSFGEVLGDPLLRGQWFAQMLQLSFVGGLTGEYLDFTAAQKAAFLMVAQRAGVGVSEKEAEVMVHRMSSLPAYAEVDEALGRLRDAPVTVVALTNSVAAVAETQLSSAGIRGRFDKVLSADEVRHLKPAREAYELVAGTCGVGLEQVRLVAAHSWDVSGALAAGCKAAFVARPGMVPSPVGRQPDIIGKDLGEVVDKILAIDLT